MLSEQQSRDLTVLSFRAQEFVGQVKLIEQEQDRLFHAYNKAEGINAWVDRAYYTTPRYLRYQYAHWETEFHGVALLQPDFARLAEFDYLTLSWPTPQ